MSDLRPVARSYRRSRRRGFSLLELIALLAILGILYTLSGILITPAIKRSQLAGAAENVATLARRVPPESQAQQAGQGRVVFLKATTATRLFELVADTNPPPGGDSVYQDPAGAGTDSLLVTVPPVQLPPGIVFHNPGAPYDNCWSNWGASGANFVVGVDFQGRTIGPNGSQINGTASLDLTHADMVSGAVTPLVVHRITIGAVWNVRHTRLVRDTTVASGWREF